MYLEAFGLNGCDWNLYGVWHRSTNGMSTDEHSERLREFGAEGHKDDRSSGLRKERQTHWWVNERVEKGVRDAECVGGGGGGSQTSVCHLSLTLFYGYFIALAYCSRPDSLLQGSAPLVNPSPKASGGVSWHLTLLFPTPSPPSWLPSNSHQIKYEQPPLFPPLF